MISKKEINDYILTAKILLLGSLFLGSCFVVVRQVLYWLAKGEWPGNLLKRYIYEVFQVLFPNLINWFENPTIWIGINKLAQKTVNSFLLTDIALGVLGIVCSCVLWGILTNE